MAYRMGEEKTSTGRIMEKNRMMGCLSEMDLNNLHISYRLDSNEEIYIEFIEEKDGSCNLDGTREEASDLYKHYRVWIHDAPHWMISSLVLNSKSVTRFPGVDKKPISKERVIDLLVFLEQQSKAESLELKELIRGAQKA